MPKRRSHWKETAQKYDFFESKSGRLRFLTDVVKAYERAYPARFRFYLREFKKLKQVMKPRGYTDAKGRQVWSDNIPTEPLLFVQRWIPNFGTSPDWPDDMNMLKKAWEDFVCTPNRRHFKHTTFFKGGKCVSPQSSTQEQERPEAPDVEGGSPEGDSLHRIYGGGDCPAVGDDDHPQRPGRLEEVPTECEADPADQRRRDLCPRHRQ